MTAKQNDTVVQMPAGFWTRSEAATNLNRTVKTLANRAALRKSPVYYSLGDGTAVYPAASASATPTGDYWTRAEAAAYLRLSVGTLGNWASQGRGPAYHRLESGTVVYAVEDLAAWLNEQRITPKVA